MALALAVIAVAVVAVPLVVSGSAPSRSAQAAPPPSHVREPGGEISIAWVGDITPGSRYGLPPAAGRSLFEAVRRRLHRPDLTIGNLEGTLSTGGASKCPAEGGECFSFQAPPDNAAGLRWAGFDLLNLANNHAWDFGAAGQRQTVDALKRHRLSTTGRPGEITVLRRSGIRIAAVGFAPYPWANDLRARGAARDLVRAADKRADLVIVLAHLGGEGADQTHVPPGREVAMGEERGDTRAFAHGVVEAGADLVLGSGPHVLRGIEVHRGKLIAYSLGNFAGWHNFSTTGTLALSGILEVNLSKTGALRGGRFTSLKLNGPGAPRGDSSGEAKELIGRLSVEDFGEKGLRLLDSGSF